MSGIYIPGMEMPTNCCQCPVNTEVCKRGYKYLLEHPELYDKRADDCPLVPVPPHGRLGDLDLLTKVLKVKATNPLNKETTPYSWAFAYECLADAVGDMPTIIPADPADKEGEG